MTGSVEERAPVADEELDALVGELRSVSTRLAESADRSVVPVVVAAWTVGGEPVAISEALSGGAFAPVDVGHRWGPPWDTTWFRLRGQVPDDWAGCPVELHVDLGYHAWDPGFQAEGLVVDAAGHPVRGMHPRQQRLLLTAAAAGGEEVELFLEAAANPNVEELMSDRSDTSRLTTAEPLYELRCAELAVPAREQRALAVDLDVLATLLAVRHQTGATPQRVAAVADACRRVRDLLAEGADDEAVGAARARLAPLLGVPAAEDAPWLSLVGHAHLDTAWLWPVRETVRKAVRTYANVLALMDDDADLTFAGTQAVHHAWVRDRHPELWSRLVERAREGRWVPVGGMWVESDVLLASGESLARQLVQGQRFFRDHLGREARTGWLPDCFGYSPVLPQLFRQAGIDAFLTQKLSWNDTNRFPHRTFWWEGLDGSRVLCHFPTVDTYNADLGEDDLRRVTRHDTGGPSQPDSLAPFGYGDGGGGPTRLMLDRARRMRSLAGLPRTRHVDPDVFFASLDRHELPSWRGDLYLEFHRGVWTSQRKTKLGDAQGDEALRQAETWCATATRRLGSTYPQDQLDELWRRHLVLEFHDILPGSSITRVHEEAEAEHAEILAAALRLRDHALAELGGGPRSTSPWVVPRPDADGWVLENTTLRARLDAGGQVVSLVDLADGRELVPAGERLGLLQAHPDRPESFDAWNLDRTYLATCTDVVTADRVVGAADGVHVTRRLGTSTVREVWRMPGDEPRLCHWLEVDWQETDTVVKLSHPFDLRGAHVTAGVQHGFLQRPLHENTSWEQARFEDWFHGFLHVAEGATSVAVVTAHAHGYDATSTVRRDGGTTTRLRTTLLRAPTFPDPVCDRGLHELRVDVLVATGLAGTTQAALAARSDLVAAPFDAGVEPIATVAGDGVVVDAVKLADDGTDDVVVRMHEALGARTSAQVRAPGSAWVRCDLLERPVAPEQVLVDGVAAVVLRPFEIVTLRLFGEHPPPLPEATS